MVMISIAKLLLVICGLVVLLFMGRETSNRNPLNGLFTPIAVVVAFFAFATSLLWTVAPQAEALGALAKYGKLVMMVLMVVIIRDRREAIVALGVFVLAQTLLVMSSWLLFAQLPVPWASSHLALTEYAVFSSYLDQGIMGAVLAGICWHLRQLAPGRFGSQLAIFVALMALANVLFVLSGRTAHVVAIALVSLAIMWELPKKYRPVIVVLPFLLAMGMFFTSTKVRDRLTLVQTEVQLYSSREAPATSSGIRLNLWRTAIDSMRLTPLAGAGVGSWSPVFNQLQRQRNSAHVDINSNGNPHQEYLLWGVQLGVPGILLFLGLLVSIWRDTVKMEKPYRHAAQSTLAALAISCLFNSSIYDAQIGDFFCILLGLLLALGLKAPPNQPAVPPQFKQLA
ncbi:MAG: O-antigen polymerase [Polaromonas sp.]|nr:O-antigen polymerase [Polaromonas sp.]